tara:strand:+ start:2509 stop:2760 length:252 start_codon:yes stop_codon:yes gene_type:complete
MNGDFLASSGNVYENFQMLGYVYATDPPEAVRTFFDDPPFPIDWSDIKYMWAEPLQGSEDTGHYGDYGKIYIEELMSYRKNIS